MRRNNDYSSTDQIFINAGYWVLSTDPHGDNILVSPTEKWRAFSDTLLKDKSKYDGEGWVYHYYVKPEEVQELLGKKIKRKRYYHNYVNELKQSQNSHDIKS